MTQTTAVQVAQQTPLTSIAAALAAASAIPAMSLVLERSVFPHVPWAWRTAIVAAFAVNLFAVSIPGRLDGQAQREGPRQWATLFAPAQWAFAIWGLIYIFETAFTVYAAFGAQGALAEALRQATPHWVTAHLMQSLWCVLFRPHFKSSLWLPALALSMTGFALLQTHTALSAADASARLSLSFVRAPVSIHFAWMAAAALLNWNSFLNAAGASLLVQEVSAFASAFAGAAVGAAVGWRTSDPFVPLTVAWALSAVSQQTFAQPLVKIVPVDVARVLAITEGALASALVGMAGLITAKSIDLF